MDHISFLIRTVQTFWTDQNICVLFNDWTPLVVEYITRMGLEINLCRFSRLKRQHIFAIKDSHKNMYSGAKDLKVSR